jgi:hypothetical protein
MNDGSRMRLGKVAAWFVALVFAVFLALSVRPPGTGVWAQVVVAPPAPLPAPPPAPGAAMSPAPPPGLLPAPGGSPLALASPTPMPRSFQCSCYGPATSVRWMGTVQSQNAFQARQTAVNSCLAYNFNRRPTSAYIAPPRFGFFPTPSPPIGTSETEPGLPTLQAPGVSGFALLSSSRAIDLRLCSLCSCN